MKLTYIRLLVDDFKSSLHFYRDTLGFPLVGGKEEWEYIELDSGSNTLLAMMPRREMEEAIRDGEIPPEYRQSNSILLIFEVNDVDAAAQELQAKGITLAAPVQDRPEWGIRTAHFRDPDGNLIEINASLTG